LKEYDLALAATPATSSPSAAVPRPQRLGRDREAVAASTVTWPWSGAADVAVYRARALARIRLGEAAEATGDLTWPWPGRRRTSSCSLQRGGVYLGCHAFSWPPAISTRDPAQTNSRPAYVACQARLRLNQPRELPPTLILLARHAGSDGRWCARPPACSPRSPARTDGGPRPPRPPAAERARLQERAP